MSLIKIGANPEALVQVPGFPGFKIKVQYLDPQLVKAIGKSHTVAKLDRKTRQMVEEVDQEAFTKEMSRRMIRGWEGLTVAILDTIIPLSDEGKKELVEKYKGELPYSEEDAGILVDNAYTRSFLELVMQTATDLALIREAQAAALEKN